MEKKDVSYWQYVALICSLLSASKVIFEFKVFLRHEDRELKLLGGKDYDENEGNIHNSVMTYVFIIVYLLSFTFSLGIFSEAYRPYGVILYTCLIFILSFILSSLYRKYLTHELYE